ncbi:pleiotropic drug resistance protein, partial [Trifolium medium]|nr:pleiotropic drug resistance protein [Trifolium medium]
MLSCFVITIFNYSANEVQFHEQFTGKVSYNGHEMNELVPQRIAAYASQNDVHLGELTVRETLAFSARVQGIGPRY